MQTLLRNFRKKVDQFIWNSDLSEQEFLVKRTLFYWNSFNWLGILTITPLALVLGAYPLLWFYLTLHGMFIITTLLFGTRISFKPSYVIQLHIYILVIALFAGYLGGILYSGGITLMGMYCMFMTAPFRNTRITTSIVLFYVFTMVVLFALSPYLHPHPGLSVSNNNIFFSLSMICHTSLQVLFIIDFFRKQKKLEENEKRLLHELDSTKTRLYTNITHEFRTPITLIMGMANELKTSGKNTATAISTIENNGRKLLRLVNQMLSMSKLESGKFQLQLIQYDIIHYIQFICKNMEASAHIKDISLQFTSTIDELYMDFDPHKLEEVLSNLLSNAIRYTEKGGKVEVKVETQTSKDTPTQLIIKVKDNGCGMHEKHLEHIFDRFYQIEESYQHHQEGSGIGLALVNENIKIMGGRIEVKSKEEIGSIFKVILPIKRKAEKINILPTQEGDNSIAPVHPSGEENERVFNKELPILLIIEDHPEMITYIASLFENEYEIITAEDGKVGLRQAHQYIPDIIISDVMMPKMDGFEFLKILKSNIRTNHIPVIMLTARADLTSKLEGLGLGAEVYLSKPFNKEELKIRLKKLLQQREILQQRYLSQNLLERPDDDRFQREDQFMEKVHDILYQRLDDANFNVDALARATRMSRSQLYRKFNALTNTSVDKYIRKYRLHQAMHLIKTTDLNVSQVALEVGIPNLAYFSRVFKEEFDCPPSKVYV